MRRVMLFDNLGGHIGEIAHNDVLSMERRDEINGEHSLTITTTQVLTQGTRILYQDDRSVWREYVVVGVDEQHSSGKTVIGSYYCVWSMQVDMQGIPVSKMPGTQTPVTAGAALASLLEGQQRWTRGTVTHTATGGASMYDMSAWQALGVLVEVWGGEIDATIAVSSTDCAVTSRKIDLYSQQGTAEAKRRYDFGRDVNGITRSIEDSPIYCRISPRGKGEETEGGGYGRKIRITDVNDGKDYLEYAPMVDSAKLPNGSGYIYPTLIVENSECETPQELLTWAQGILEETLQPKVSYEIDAVQAAREGVDVQGVSLGDVVQVVDRYFNGDDGLRVTGRIMSLVVDELSTKNVSVTIGSVSESLSVRFSNMQKLANSASARINEVTSYLATAEYVNNLIGRLNAEINATGGYTYIVPGHGVLTFNTAVADPLNPTEASSVVEIKGGSIRIANSKTAQGEWDWRTVFVSGHIAAELITSANITTGYIGNASGGFFLDLDNGIYRMPTTMTVGGSTVQSIANSAAESAATAQLTNFIEGDYADNLQDIQSQVDQKAETWYQSADPSSAWSTSAIKAQHKGDLWYDTDDGKTYRYSGSAWVEQPVPDAVFDAIDGKAQIFTSTPTVPYSKGDLWFNSSTSDIMTCITARATGSYTATDWQKRNKYTDDTRAVQAESNAKDYTDSKATSTLSQADINAQAITDALDASLDQQEVIDRLLGTSQGIAVDPETGDLYISGTLIKVGTIDAALIKAGILTDAAGKNYWNMVTGYINTAYGKIGGFDITSSAIYHTLTSLTATGLAGVYVGTDGIAVADTDGEHKAKFTDGRTEYYYNGVSVGHIQALYGSGSRGLGLYAPNRLYFESPAIQLYKNNTLSTAIDMALEVYVLKPKGNANGVLKFDFPKLTMSAVNGIITAEAMGTSTTEQNIEMVTKGYVDSGLSAKADSSSLATVATSGRYTDLSNRPSLASVATSGSYNDLSDKPTIPSAYTLPTASSSTLGGVKVDDVSATVSNGVLKPANVRYGGFSRKYVNFSVDGTTLNITFSSS